MADLTYSLLKDSVSTWTSAPEHKAHAVCSLPTLTCELAQVDLYVYAPEGCPHEAPTRENTHKHTETQTNT
jgi:hypothetical protein